MTMTDNAPRVSLVRVVLTTGDGQESRRARGYMDGSYSCPFCSAAIISPAGHEYGQDLNAQHYARTGEAYTREAYSPSMRQTWEARTCGNPMCLVALPAARCAEIRAQREARAAEEARRAYSHACAMQRIAEDNARQHAACDAARERCAASGECFACWAHSTFLGISTTRERWIRHRTGTTCAHVRRYGTA